MKKHILFSTLFLLGCLMLSCLVTLMVVFTGGSFTGADLTGLFLIQLFAVPVTTLIVAREIAAFVRPNGWARGLAMLWQKIPAWLVLALVLLNSLVLIGELSVVLLNHLMEEPVPWTEHVPLVALLSTSLAFSVMYAKVAQLYWNGTVTLGRWP